MGLLVRLGLSAGDSHRQRRRGRRGVCGIFQLLLSRRSAPTGVLATFAMPWGAWSISAGQLVAAGSIAVITAINYVGVRSGNLANTVLTAAKVAALVALPLLAIAYMRVDPVLIASGAVRAFCGRWRRSASS